MRNFPKREDAGTMLPSENADLHRLGRGLIGRRWTSVVTSVGVGVVLVALAARFGAVAAARDGAVRRRCRPCRSAARDL